MALTSCEALVEKRNIARTTSDQRMKQEIIKELREKVCNKKERKVCCENKQEGEIICHKQLGILVS